MLACNSRDADLRSSAIILHIMAKCKPCNLTLRHTFQSYQLVHTPVPFSMSITGVQTIDNVRKLPACVMTWINMVADRGELVKRRGAVFNH